MDKANSRAATHILVVAACLLFVFAYFVPAGNLLAAHQEAHDWAAHPMFISQLAEPNSISGYTPDQIRTAYNLPSTGGGGATIAIIDAFHSPNILADLTYFSNEYGLPAPDSNNFAVHRMSSYTGSDSGWGQETSLDVEWAHAIAPNAKILLVEARSAHDNDLLAAVDWATSQPGVVSVSMSWGGPEDSGVTWLDSHFSKAGIAFFASAGDNGTELNWPAVSPNVVAVGGTTLNLNPDNIVNSEIAWSGSGGGISTVEAAPAYQTNYGLNSSQRLVPDVSYNADPNTGVRVRFNSQWYIIGGTSAGAPQWAAIHALGVSATNPNLYQRAKSAYSSYFRDITLGSNGLNASVGYDLVTGLGSPLTMNFGTYLDVSPTSGPAGAPIQLAGVGFTGSANISYLNTSSSVTWVPIADNVTTEMGNFTYSLNAPDLLQNNPAGDSQPLSGNIIFRAKDNGNGQSYNSTVSFAQWRRGITQVRNMTAAGVYGNNTDFAASVLAQNGESFSVSGKWFNPGTVSLLWDGITELGTATADETGSFTAAIQVPTATAGQHTITIKDTSSTFGFNLTRLPALTTDYVGGWHSSDYTVNITSDSAVNETFYRINGGPTYNVTSNGPPAITTEGNNTLEYWSTWNLTSSSPVELPHVTQTSIMLDKTAPTGSITSSTSQVQTPTVTLGLYATDDLSGVAQMRFSNGNDAWSDWEPYAAAKTWSLPSGDGVKTVAVQFKDNAGVTSSYSTTVTLLAPTPTPSPSPSPSPAPTTTPTPTATPLPTASPTPSPTSSPTPMQTPSPTLSPSNFQSNSAFESLQVILMLFAVGLAVIFGSLYVVKLRSKH